MFVRTVSTFCDGDGVEVAGWVGFQVNVGDVEHNTGTRHGPNSPFTLQAVSVPGRVPGRRELLRRLSRDEITTATLHWKQDDEISLN